MKLQPIGDFLEQSTWDTSLKEIATHLQHYYAGDVWLRVFECFTESRVWNFKLRNRCFELLQYIDPERTLRVGSAFFDSYSDRSRVVEFLIDMASSHRDEVERLQPQLVHFFHTDYAANREHIISLLGRIGTPQLIEVFRNMNHINIERYAGGEGVNYYLEQAFSEFQARLIQEDTHDE